MYIRIVLSLLLMVTTFSAPGIHAASILVRSNLPGASLQVDNQQKVLTDQDGLAFISGIPPGSHQITITKQGYETYTEKVIVKDKLTTIIQAELVILDQAPPEIKLLSPVPMQGIRISLERASVQLIGLARDKSGVASIVINGQRAELVPPDNKESNLLPGKTFKFISEVSLGVGSNTIRIEAVDSIGNRETFDQEVLAILDRTLPEIRLLSPEQITSIRIAAIEQTIQLIGLARDESGIASVSINGQSVELLAPGSEEMSLLPGKTVKFISKVSLSVGSNTIQLEAVDSTGNRQSFVQETLAIFDQAPPEIRLLSPAPVRGMRITAKEEKISITGLARDDGGVASVSVNGQRTELIPPGGEEMKLLPGKTVKFITEVSLDVGSNSIRIEAVDSAGNRDSVEQIIDRKSELLASLNMTCRALLIAVNDYQNWGKLHNPITDIRALDQELRENYDFQTNVLVNPKKTEILSSVRNYYNQEFFENDELLIVLAGHGHFDELSKTGAFISTDAKTPSQDPNFETYIGYPILENLITHIPCKHILVVLDACFGGTFFREVAMRGEDDVYRELPPKEKILRKMKFKSRMLLTSGGKEYVPDGRPGDHSPFMRRFLEGLRNYGGTDKILGVDELKVIYMDAVNPQPFLGEFLDNEPGSNFLFIAN